MNPPFLRRVASTTRLFCFLACVSPLGAWAQADATRAADPAPAAPSPAADTPARKPATDEASVDAPSPPRFGITLETDDTLKPFVLRHIDLQRFRTLSDLDSSELDRLLLAAPDNLRDLLGTQGYFSPTITFDPGCRR